MTGTWLRGPDELKRKHQCEPPGQYGIDPERWTSCPVGVIWRCPCGRRWITKLGLGRTMPVWKRRRLPWPRRTAEERRQADERRQEEAIDRALAAGRPLPKGMIKAPGQHTPIVFDMSPTPNAGEPPAADQPKPIAYRWRQPDGTVLWIDPAEIEVVRVDGTPSKGEKIDRAFAAGTLGMKSAPAPDPTIREP